MMTQEKRSLAALSWQPRNGVSGWRCLECGRRVAETSRRWHAERHGDPAQPHHRADLMALTRSLISETPLTATATLSVETAGEGFVDITREVARFVADIGAREGALFLFIRHTSASLTIQENADPDVQTDLVTALRRIAPNNAPW